MDLEIGNRQNKENYEELRHYLRTWKNYGVKYKHCIVRKNMEVIWKRPKIKLEQLIEMFFSFFLISLVRIVGKIEKEEEI